MSSRIEVTSDLGVEGSTVRNRISDLGLSVDEVKVIDAYTLDGEGEPANGRYPYNPNGSMDDIAAICDPTGRLMIIMPHPERYLTPYHHPQWQRQRTEGRLPKEGHGLQIFKNAVRYFS